MEEVDDEEHETDIGVYGVGWKSVIPEVDVEHHEFLAPFLFF